METARGSTSFPSTKPKWTSPCLHTSSTTARPVMGGDWLMLAKYRFLAAGPDHANYSLSASINGTVPTGSYKNGSSDGSIEPTLYGGKGFGRFDAQSSLALTLPTGHTAKSGRPISWNTVAQCSSGRSWNQLHLLSRRTKRWPNSGIPDARSDDQQNQFSRESNNRLAFNGKA